MLETNRKEDILVPFERVGEPGWKNNTQKILDSYADLWEEELPDPVTEAELAKVEKRLGVRLPDGLKLFYHTFGQPNIGEQLVDIEEMIWVKDLWKDNPYGPDFTEEDKTVLPYLITFSDYLGNGNIFCFHSETQEVYYYDHDDRPYMSKMFSKVDDYLKGCLVGMQAELAGEEADQDELEEWIEEKLNTLFGAAIVQKWRY